MLDWKKSSGFNAIIVPYEATVDGSYSTLYRMWGADDYYSTTQLKVTYLDNTKFIDELKVTTKDNVADTMTKIGDVVKAAMPFLAAALVSSKDQEMTFNKTMVDPAQAGIDKWTKDPLNKDYCVRIKDVAVESSFSMQQYIAAGLDKWQNTFPVPACVTGIVEIASPCDNPDANIKGSIPVKFADADKVLPMALPSSGLLKMNSICGASVTEADQQDRTELLEYLSKAMTQIQEVSAAWKKAKAAQ
jgi:hypothetical protein